MENIVDALGNDIVVGIYTSRGHWFESSIHCNVHLNLVLDSESQYHKI